MIWKIGGISWFGGQFRPTVDCDLENWRDFVSRFKQRELRRRKQATEDRRQEIGDRDRRRRTGGSGQELEGRRLETGGGRQNT